MSAVLGPRRMWAARPFDQPMFPLNPPTRPVHMHWTTSDQYTDLTMMVTVRRVSFAYVRVVVLRARARVQLCAGAHVRRG